MTIEIDNDHFCIRMYHDLAYFKTMGHHGKEEAIFFDNLTKQMLHIYKHPQFATLCNFKEMVLSEHQAAFEINKTIKRIANSVNYKCNAIVVNSKFFDVMKAYVFSFYLRNINVNTKIFTSEDEALNWIKDQGFETEEISRFVESKKAPLDA